MGRDGKGKVERICEVCGRRFETYYAWLRDGKAGKFCSKDCQVKGMRRRSKIIMNAICEECGKTFSYRKGRGGTYTYCSNECRAIGNGKKFSGPNHPFWKGGISKRKSPIKLLIEKLKKERGKCNKCNSEKNLQGHHIIPICVNIELANDPKNIEILCDICHAKEHPEYEGMIRRPRIRKGLIVECKQCGKEYYVPQYKKNITKYCSRECKHNGQKGHSVRKAA